MNECALTSKTNLSEHLPDHLPAIALTQDTPIHTPKLTKCTFGQNTENHITTKDFINTLFLVVSILYGQISETTFENM